MALNQVPQFAWPAHRETLEDDLVVTTGDTITTALQSDSSPTEAQIITNIFTSATDFLSKATKNITSTNMDAFNSRESTTEQPINVQEKTYSKVEDMFGSAVSKEISPLQSSVAETNPVDIITEIFSKTISTERPPHENGNFNSTSWEQPILATSKYPLIDTSEFGINMNTESSSTIDTMKEILVETVLKEKGLFEGETTEKPISTTSNTIKTLKDMFMRAVAKEEPLLDAAKTESSLFDFETSTEKPLFESFSVEKPFLDINSVSTEKPFIQNMTISEAPIEISINTSSAMDKITDIFKNSMTTENNTLFEKYVSEQSVNDSSVTTTNSNFETLTDMLSSTLETEESSIEFVSTQREHSFFQSNFEKMKDTLSKTLATEEPSIELGRRTFQQMNDMLSTTEHSSNLSSNTKTNNTIDLMADILNRSIPTEQPFLRITSTFDNMKDTLSTEESAIDYSQSTFENMKDILSTTEEASIEIGQIIKTNSTTDIMADVFNNTSTEKPIFQLTNTIENIKNTLSSTDKPSVELGQSTLEQVKEMLSITKATEESSFDFGSSSKTNSTINILEDVFKLSTSVDQPFIQTTSTSEKIKEMLLTPEELPIELRHSTFEQLKDMLSTTRATEEPSIIFDLGIKTNGTTDIITEVFNRSKITEPPVFRSTSILEIMKDTLPTQDSVTEFGHSTLENMKDILTKAEPSIDFRQSINTNSTIDTMTNIFNTTPTDQTFIHSTSTSEKIKEMLLSTEEPPIELSHSTFEQLKNMLSTTQATEEPSIVFDLGIKTNGTSDIITEVFNRSKITEPPFFRSTSILEKMKDTLPTQDSVTEFGHSTLENMKDILTTAEPSIDFRQSINTNSTIDTMTNVFNTTPTEQTVIHTTSTSEKIKEMLLSTEEPPIKLSHSTFEQLKDMLSTTQATEEPSIVFDLGIKTNGTTDIITEVLNGSKLTEPPFFRSTSILEKMKDTLPTQDSVTEFGHSTLENMKDILTKAEPSIDFRQSINTNSTIDTMTNIFNTTPTDQTFIHSTSTSEKIKEMLLSTEEPPIELGHSTFEQLKNMLSTTQATEEPSIVFDLGIKTNTSDIITEVFNRSKITEPPFFRSTSILEKMKDTLPTQDSVTEFGHSTLENMKDILTKAEPSIDFRQSTNTNSTIDTMTNIFNTTPTDQTFIHTTSTSEKIKEMLLSTEEPPIELSHSTFEQLKDMLSTTRATEEPSIVFDMGIKTNGTTDIITEVFNRSKITEPPFFRSTSILEKMKDTLPTQNSVTEFGHSTLENMKDILTNVEPSIDFRQSINTNIDTMANVFNTTPTEQTFIHTTSTSEKIKEMLLSTEEPPIELSHSTFEQLKDMLSTTRATEEPSIVFDMGIKTNGTTDIITEVFNRSKITEPPFFRSTSILEKMKDTLPTQNSVTEFGHSTLENMKDILTNVEPSIDFRQSINTNIDTMANVFNTTPTEQTFIHTTSTSEKFKEMLLSTEEPPIKLSHSTFEQLKDMLSTTQATEEPSIVFDVGIKTNGTTDIIAEVLNRSKLTEPPFFRSRSILEKMKDTLPTQESVTEFGHSTLENMKDTLTKVEPSIDFRPSRNTNGTIDMIANIFNTTPTEQTFIQTTSTSEKIKEILLSTEEPPIELSHSTFKQLKDMLSTTQATEEPSIVFDLGANTNGTTDMIADIFSKSTLAEQPFFRRTSTFEKMKDVLPTEQPLIEFSKNFEKIKDELTTTQESSIELNQSINTNGMVNMTDIFNGSTSTQQTFFQNTNTFETIKDILATEELPIEFGQTTFQKMKEMMSSTTEQSSFEFNQGTKSNITDLIAKKIEDMLTTEEPSIEFGPGTNTKSIIDTITNIFNGTTSIPSATKESSIELGESTFEKIQQVWSTTGEPPIQFGHNTNSNRTGMIEHIFNKTTSTTQTFVQNTSTFEKIKDMLSTTWATDEPSIKFSQTNYDKMSDLVSITTTEKPFTDFVRSTKTNSTIDMIKDIFNSSTSTEQSISLNNTFVTLQEMISVSPTEINTGSNDILALVKNTNTEHSFEEPININATSNVDLTGIYKSAGIQAKLNSAIEMFTTELSTETTFTSSTSLPENSSIYFNNNATSNSTKIFRPDPSIFQSSLESDFMNPIENKMLTEDALSTSISPIKKTFEDVLSTVSSNFSSTSKEALGNTDGQNQMVVESSWTIYTILGTILAVLIILTVGGYIICRKYRRNRKSGGGYYVTHLKNYSDSSVKTVSDSDTVNIKL